jgi:release factor glutamine methyltransferase
MKAGSLTEERLLASPQDRLPAKAEAFYFRLVGRRRTGFPLAYLTGSREFWSIPLKVGPGVLVPRPETEVLVEKVLELATRGRELILDVGTGSGNIAIALAKELPRAVIYASDVSDRALRLAGENAASNKIRRVQFVKSSLFSAFRGTGLLFDFIVANPPYVSRRDWQDLPAEIRDFEPRQALLAGDSGLELIARLIRRSAAFLKPGGHLIFEIGAGQRPDVLRLFGPRWTEIETAWDLAGTPRVITARRAR